MLFIITLSSPVNTSQLCFFTLPSIPASVGTLDHSIPVGSSIVMLGTCATATSASSCHSQGTHAI